MKVAIVGTRRRDAGDDYRAVEEAFKRLLTVWPDAEIGIVSGGCSKGGDRFAEGIAEVYGLPITIFYPDWRRYGRAAGPIRNKLIAAECDIMIACVAENRMGGTEDAIRKVKKLGKEVILVEGRKM